VRVIVSIVTAYAARCGSVAHPDSDPLSGAVMAGVAAAAGAGAWAASPQVGMLAGAAVWIVVGLLAGPSERRPARALIVLVVVGALAGWRGGAEWRELADVRTGPFDGWAEVVDDPRPYPGSLRAVLELDGERFEMWARGRALRQRVGSWRGGDIVRLNGMRREIDDERLRRVAWQHVVGEVEYEWASDVLPGSPLARASNRVRSTIERGAAALPDAEAALFRGLVIGDDRDQPEAMLARFRASGLSHLTAVSGQNVGFLLAAAGPLLRGLRPSWRWAATVALIGWFVALTRFEPSIIRAGTMAAISATAFVLGRPRAPARLLCLAATGLILVDPLLVHSIGFVLSVGATAGVAVLGPRLAGRLRALGPLAMPLGVTLGAQLGVALPSVLVFGRLPLVSVPANLLAVPVAGFVMLYGLPAGLLAGAAPPLAPVVMLPCHVGVRWVDTVAALAARLEPGGAATWFGWAALGLAVGWWALAVPGAQGDRVEPGE